MYKMRIYIQEQYKCNIYDLICKFIQANEESPEIYRQFYLF